jgi:hypothetical protein
MGSLEVPESVGKGRRKRVKKCFLRIRPDGLVKDDRKKLWYLLEFKRTFMVPARIQKNLHGEIIKNVGHIDDDKLQMYSCYTQCDYNFTKNVEKRARMTAHRNQPNPE